ncbi:hypothetical protein BDR07DRAFT_1489981 [Suillus spraguei]|nr:hypothetical protein BDR07DRAFT_1489981 [Suillus spraguei]
MVGLTYPPYVNLALARLLDISPSNITNQTVTYWSGYKNWGCTAKGSKKRHIEQHLMNVPINADYKEFCATTPARFLDQEFFGADSCVNSIWGVYGQWFINDPSC